MNPIKMLFLGALNTVAFGLWFLLPAPDHSWTGGKINWTPEKVHFDILRLLRDEGSMTYELLYAKVDYDDDHPDTLPLSYHIGLLWKHSGYAKTTVSRRRGIVKEIWITQEGLDLLDDFEN